MGLGRFLEVRRVAQNGGGGFGRNVCLQNVRIRAILQSENKYGSRKEERTNEHVRIGATDQIRISI